MQNNIDNSSNLKYLFDGRFGDTVHFLGIVNEIYISTGLKGIIYIAEQYIPYQFGLLNTFNEMYNLVKSQPYVHILKIWEGESYDVNLGNWRFSTLMFKNNLVEIFRLEYKISWASHPWLTTNVDHSLNNLVLVNISLLRNNTSLDFSFLDNIKKKYRLAFLACHVNQYNNFKKIYPKIDLILAGNIEDMFKYIYNCKYFIGNLSAPLALAFACHKKCYAIFGSPNSPAGGDTVLFRNLNLPFLDYFENYNDYSLHPNDVVTKIES